MTMKIQLSSQPAAEVWGENALISFQNDQTIIHFTEKQNINDIQKAARKLRNQNFKEVELVGDNWQLEHCWAF